MVRAPCCEKMGLKKGPWTPEEDQILISFINKYGHGNWRALPKQAGLLRCGKSCRLRWINYLRPDIKRGNFTREEEETIIKLHESLGNRWSAIAARLPGRTDNEIKNVWHTHLKKRLNSDSNKDFSTKRQRITHGDKTKVTDQSKLTDHHASVMSVNSPPQPCSSSDFSSVTDASVGGEETTINDNDQNDNMVLVVKGGFDDYNENNNMESYHQFSSFAEIDASFWSDQPNSAHHENINQLEYFLDAQIQNDPLSTSLSNNSNCDQYDIDFWYDIFIKAGGSPELPEF